MISDRVVRELREFRQQHPDVPIYCVWSFDIEKAALAEERAKLRGKPIEVNPLEICPRLSSRGVTFIAHRELPAGTLYFSTTEPEFAS